MEYCKAAHIHRRTEARAQYKMIERGEREQNRGNDDKQIPSVRMCEPSVLCIRVTIKASVEWNYVTKQSEQEIRSIFKRDCCYAIWLHSRRGIPIFIYIIYMKSILSSSSALLLSVKLFNSFGKNIFSNVIILRCCCCTATPHTHTFEMGNWQRLEPSLIETASGCASVCVCDTHCAFVCVCLSLFLFAF